MPNLKPIEILLLILVVVVLFGAKRMPDAARGIGRSLRIFKSEVKGLRDDDLTAADPPAGVITVEQVSKQAIIGPETRSADAPPIEHGTAGR